MSLTETRAPLMTLGRFVRVTLHNFRLLITTFSGTTVADSMTQPVPDEHKPTSDAAASEPQARPADPKAMESAPVEPAPDAPAAVEPEAMPAAPGATGATDEEDAYVLQPELDLATDAAHAALTATTDSGKLHVRVGDAALSLFGALEGLLFVADGPVETTQMARALEMDAGVVEALLRQLDDEYRSQGRGFRLMERNGRFQLVTAPAAAAIIETFLNLDMTAKLSAPALETLAVVAYRQPVTRAQVEAVRGVDCSGILRSLLQRGLIEEVDRLDAPGRPVLYGVTDLFMRHFGLTSLHELPPLETNETEQLDKVLDAE